MQSKYHFRVASLHRLAIVVQLRTLLRCPVGMCGEEPVREADLEGNKQTEGYANQSRCESEATIERRESLACVGKRRTDNQCDQHHSGNCPQPKDEKIRNRPAWIANGGQDKQGDGSGAGESVHKPNREGPEKLIEPQTLHCILESAAGIPSDVAVNLRSVDVNVLMKIPVMSMEVGVNNSVTGVAVTRCKPMGDPLRNAREIEYSEED